MAASEEPFEPYGTVAVRGELRRAAETGGGVVSRQQLIEQCGLGAGDLAAALRYLREWGEVSEVAPGEFELVVGDPDEAEEADAAEDERARTGESLALPGAPRVSAAQVAQVRERTRRPFGEMLATSDATVKLTRGVADALDAPTLGAIVKAGIAEAGDQPFRLEVI